MDIAVGVLLAAAGLVAVGLVVALLARRRVAAETAPVTAEQVDDLPDFLESPPGSATPARPASVGVVALTPLPTSAASPSAASPSAAPHRPMPVAVPAVLAGLVVLLLVAAAVVATASAGDAERHERPPARVTTSDEARLRFGGIVLEERAVGVTVSYPELTLDAGTDGPVASLQLPTWNCLAVEAPEDPVEARCAPGRTEYARLGSPDLEVTRDGDGLRIAGAFATATRSTGSGPQPTDKRYDLIASVRADDAARSDRWVPASGELELGGRRTTVVEGELRFHD